MIISFKDKRTRSIYDGVSVKRIDKNLYNKARRQIQRVNAAVRIEDFYFPTSNRFHALEGSNPTRYAIYVNDQWRVSFEWEDGNANNVLYEDYH